jgi:hypothetical protein
MTGVEALLAEHYCRLAVSKAATPSAASTPPAGATRNIAPYGWRWTAGPSSPSPHEQAALALMRQLAPGRNMLPDSRHTASARSSATVAWPSSPLSRHSVPKLPYASTGCTDGRGPGPGRPLFRHAEALR